MIDRYCAAGAFAGALDIVDINRHFGEDAPKNNTFRLAFGSAEAIEGTESDIIDLAGCLHESGAQMPRLWSVVGEQDFGAGQVKGAVAKFKARGVALDDFYDMGVHSFDLWDAYIERFFDWLGLAKVQ